MSKIPNKDRIQELSEKWLNNTISETEKQEYDSWYNSFKDHHIQDLTSEELTNFLDRNYGLIKDKEGVHRSPFYKGKLKLLKRAVLLAASIVLVIFSIHLIHSSFQNNQKESLLYSSILPGKDRAYLTLDNGKVFDLDSLSSGEIMEEGGVRIEKSEDGKLLYSISDPNSHAQEITMNTVSTPKGGQFRVLLPDGSQVWLNAASSLTFSSQFTGLTRSVYLSGEAYFEVAQNKEVPFIVTTANEEVEVLGTHFNISSYKEESISTVSLLEGKVQVSVSPTDSRILKPGQQTQVNEGSIKVHPVDLNEAIAWKNGKFMFNNEGLKSMMQKIARWYDIEIFVSPELEDMTIWGSISRYDDFGKVLKIIQLTDEDIKFKVDGRRVSIMK